MTSSDPQGDTASHSNGASVSPVHSPPTLTHGPCVKVPHNQRSARQGKISAGRFDHALRESARGNGVAKLGVTLYGPLAEAPAKALIRVDVISPPDELSYTFVRTRQGAWVKDEQGKLPFYPGALVVPAREKIRITVTIGSQTACFLTHT